jgi:hypothetical protein
MSVMSKDIYRSPNGDRWRLVSDTESGQRVVRHEANPASGGYVTETDLAAFLRLAGSGPEHAALRDMLEPHIRAHRPPSEA